MNEIHQVFSKFRRVLKNVRLLYRQNESCTSLEESKIKCIKAVMNCKKLLGRILWSLQYIWESLKGNLKHFGGIFQCLKYFTSFRARLEKLKKKSWSVLTESPISLEYFHTFLNMFTLQSMKPVFYWHSGSVFTISEDPWQNDPRQV